MFQKGKGKAVRQKTKGKGLTVGSILAQDDINHILEELSKHRADIEDIVCVVIDRKGYIRQLRSVTAGEAISLLEQAKFYLLNSEADEETYFKC